MPSTLNFLQDSIVATALVMLLSVIVIFFLVGEEQINWLRMEAYKQASYKNNIVFALWIAFTLTANIVVLLYGVRMFVGELMMSFKGISEKLLQVLLQVLTVLRFLDLLQSLLCLVYYLVLLDRCLDFLAY